MKNQIYSAAAVLNGGNGYPGISGTARFCQRRDGVLVTVNVQGLPTEESDCDEKIFAMHIHSGSSCTGNAEDNFANAKMHYNPNDCFHPYHAGDLPSLFGCSGKAYMSVLTNRFSVSDIVGKTLIIHSDPDDFTTQPSGNAGTKIACGVIRGKA